jgi:hypothetical protein
MSTPTPAKIRHRVDPADVPPVKAARRLGLTLDEFRAKLPALIAAGFPPADPVTGNFGLDAIDAYRRRRDHQNPQQGGSPAPKDARRVVNERLQRIQ